MNHPFRFAILVFVTLTLPLLAQPLDERPARNGEWGFRPRRDEQLTRNPPAFSWRPQKGAQRYDLQLSQNASFTGSHLLYEDLRYNVHCPHEGLAAGRWFWRFRARSRKGQVSPWSTARSFVMPMSATPYPLPRREEVLARVPKSHPRLFVRPEDIPSLRKPEAEAKVAWDRLVARCETWIRKPIEIEEPPRYPKGTKRKSEAWRAIWWGNRRKTQAVLAPAADLAFAWHLGRDARFKDEARRRLLAAARWDPRGATGYRYNDEAGMPFAYHFARCYTFLHEALSEEERQLCREVMRIRGREMARDVLPQHLWTPYDSHDNRAWHFLGEVAIAFLGEIPEASEWLWFSLNVFANVYPVWADADGGWHEGINYWSSYIGRFTWWAAVMKSAVGIDAYGMPYFAHAGDLPLYFTPPGSRGGGFGDLCGRFTSKRAVPLMTTLARQAANPHWQWYVEAHDPVKSQGDFIAFLASTERPTQARAPHALPSAKLFRDTGLAALNSRLDDGRENVQILFKSSPFGSQSHGYDAQNSFLLKVRGERLLLRSGHRDLYGSAHHRRWMWETKSCNNILVDGKGQRPHRAGSKGEITRFHTSDHLHYVEGSAAGAYGGRLKRYTRGILFLLPDLIVLHDRLVAPEPASFSYRLHAPTPFHVNGAADIRVKGKRGACHIALAAPSNLKIETTDRFDPPPRPRVKLVQHHLSADTTGKQREVCFVSLLQPHAADRAAPTSWSCREIPGGHFIEAPHPRGRARLLLRRFDGGTIEADGLRTSGDLLVVLEDRQGRVIERYEAVDR